MKTVRAVTENNMNNACGSRNYPAAACCGLTESNAIRDGQVWTAGRGPGKNALRAGLAASMLAVSLGMTMSITAFADENAQGTTAVAVTGTGLSGRATTGPGIGTGAGTGTGSGNSSVTATGLADDNLEWDEIAGLINAYNATVIKNRTDLSTDARKSYNSREVSDYLIQKADEYDDEAYTIEDTSALTAATYRSTANNLRIQAESNVSDFEVVKLEYQLIEKQTAAAARTAFLNYYSSMYEIEYDEVNAAYLEKVYNSTRNKMNVGMATETEVLTARENLDAAKAALVKIRADHAAYKNNLIVMCGWSYDSTSAVIGALPEMSTDTISAISYDSDRTKASGNNLTLKMDEIKLKNAGSSNYTANILKQNQDQLDTDKKSFDINFRSAYDTLVNAGTAYTNAVNDKAVADRNLSMAERELGLGSISSMELESYRNSAASALLAERKAYISMLQAKAAYDAALDGNL